MARKIRRDVAPTFKLRRLHPLLTAMTEELRPETRNELGLRSCIPTSYLVVAVLTLLGVPARTLSVRVDVEHTGRGMYLDTTTETEIPDDDFGPWNGHQVVLICDSIVLDITVDQFGCPELGIEARPLWVEVSPKFASGAMSEGLPDGELTITYTARPSDHSFEVRANRLDCQRLTDLADVWASRLRTTLPGTTHAA